MNKNNNDNENSKSNEDKKENDSDKYKEESEPIDKELLKSMKTRDITIQKMLDEEFEREISKMVDQAEKIAREYELAMKKALKKGEILEKCSYNQVIEIYEEARNMLLEKGWKEQAAIYQRQIELYNEKLTKDKKLREIEQQKKVKQQEMEEYYKDLKEEPLEREDQEKIKLMKKKAEDKIFQENITNLVNKAERLSHEYEIALKKSLQKGELIRDSPYHEIIEIYKKVRDMLVERNWNEQAEIYDRQIEIYQEKEEKDIKLRQIEEEKAKKERELQENFKVAKVEKDEGIDDKTKDMELEKQKEEEFQQKISNMVNRAEKIVREYENSRKKALKEGEILRIASPYEEVIEIFQNAYELLLKKGWTDQASIYKRQIKIYQDEHVKDKKLREIEKKKRSEDKEFQKSLWKKKRAPKDEKKRKFSKEEKKDEKEFQERILELVAKAERMAREYDLAFKKALKEGKFLEENPYSEIIEIYRDVKKKLLQHGWTQQAEIYKKQVRIYEKKLENEKNLREVEAKKALKQQEIDDMHKFRRMGRDSEKEKTQKLQIKDQIEEELFEQKIDKMVDTAEKMAREYEISLRKALREGRILDKNPYNDIIGIYENLRKILEEKGWEEEAALYLKQIKFYKEKLEKDNLLKEIEAKKSDRQEEIEDFLKMGKQSITFNDEKFKSVEKKIQKDYEEEKFQNWISEKVDEAERLDHEYEMALKQGEFDIESPYPKIIEIYRDIRRKLLDKGWYTQSEIFLNQINLYKEKNNKTAKLRKVEAEKQKRQELIEEMHRMRDDKIEEIEEEIDQEKIKIEEEKKEKLDNAMNLISEAETVIKEYESAPKDKLIDHSSPYENVINNYQQARKLLLEADWINQGEKLNETIQFYRKRNDLDQKIRNLETQVYSEPEKVPAHLKINPNDNLEEREKKLEKIKVWYDKESKIYEKVFQKVNQAEEMAKTYKKSLESENILNLTNPYESIINIYKSAADTFLQEGWNEDARKFEDSVEFYEERLKEDEKLRTKLKDKLKREEEELVRQKALIKESLRKEEVKRKEKEKQKKQEDEWNKYFEEKKTQAFELIDNAKLELGKANFDNAIELYNEASKIFQTIDWDEGLSMIKGAIDSLQEMKEKYLQEQQIKHYKEEIIETKKQEAFEIIDKAKEHLKDMEFNESIAFYQKSKEIFKEIDWIEGITMVEDAIHLIYKKQELLKKEKEQEEYEVKFLRTKKEKAFELMDKAKEELDQNKFEEAVSLYNQSKDVFEEIDWKEGIVMVEDAIDMIHRKKEQLQKEKEEQEYQRDVIQTSKEKAFKLMDKATETLRKNEFEKAIEIYNEGKKIFEEINWKEGIHLIEDSIQAIRIQKNKYEKERALERYQKEVLEKKKDNAIKLMDQAKKHLTRGNFDDAIEIYNESKEAFKGIDWSEGIKMAEESIDLIMRKKEEIQREKDLEEQKEREKRNLEKLLESEIVKLEKRRKEEEKQREEDLKRLEKEKIKESKISQEAYKLLEQGTYMVDKKEFEKARESYMKARSLFEEINWQREIFRINNELIAQLEREKERFMRAREIEEKQRQEKEELKKLLSQAETQRREYEKQKRLEKRKRLMQIRKAEQPLEKALDEEEYAEILLEEGKNNEAVLKLYEKLVRLTQDSEEANRVQDKIHQIKEQSKIPIITDIFFNKKESEAFKKAYEALDNCKISLNDNNYMKAISELIEAKFNIKQIKKDKVILEKIDHIIQICRIELGREGKPKDFSAISDIMEESEVEDENKHLKSRIAARRSQRRKRIEERLKEDEDD